MASNGASAEQGVRDAMENSLEKIQRQLASGSGRSLLQGPLLKRSGTLKKWNERWVILDPTTGRMEYKTKRNEPSIKGVITFDENSVISISPLNFQYGDGPNVWKKMIIPISTYLALTSEPNGLPKYDGCCFYIGTPQKKDYFLCAETPGAARAWVSTLHATQLVLKAHKEAVNSLSGNGSAKLGTVATVVAAANSTAKECSKEIEAAMHISFRNALGLVANNPTDGPLDDFTIMKETLRVKDEELQNLARDLRARDSTIREIADKLSETAEAAQSAASAAYSMDEHRGIACAELKRLTEESEKQKEAFMSKLKESEGTLGVLSKERDQLIKQRDSAMQEAHMLRSELGKAREHVVTLEAAVLRAKEKIRVTETDAKARIREAAQKEAAAVKEKQDLLAYVDALQTPLQREQSGAKQIFEEKIESSNTSNSPPDTKDMDLSENVDKACLSVSRTASVPSESVVHVAADQVNIQPVGDGEWSDIQATEARIAYLREIAPEAEGRRHYISVFSPTIDNQHNQGTNSFHQP